MLVLKSIVATCADPIPSNGQVKPSGLTNGQYIINSTVFFMCDYEFHLQGSNSSTCEANGTWNPKLPVCREGKENI